MRLALFAFLLAATPALSQPDIRATLIAEAQARDCRLTEDDAAAVFTALGLTQDDVRPIAQRMIADGEAMVDGNIFTLLPALCEGTPAVDKMPAVIAAFEANGCVIAEAAALEALAAQGVTAAEIEAMEPRFEAMIAAGQMTEIDTPERAMRLEPPLCGPGGGDLETLLGVFRANGCTMTEAEGMPALRAAGLDDAALEALEPALEPLFDSGQIERLDDSAGTVRINEPLCSGGTPDDPAAVLVRMLEENGCRLTQATAAGLVAGYGTTAEAIDEMADILMDRGQARVEGDALVLDGCE